MDGHAQREALTAAERALELLAKGRTGDANAAAQTAADRDQVGIFAAFPQAVAEAARVLEDGGALDEQALASLRTAVGPGPLSPLVDRLRDQPAGPPIGGTQDGH